jgi:CDP-4-dehydro-6-deoxyglucose reductase
MKWRNSRRAEAGPGEDDTQLPLVRLPVDQRSFQGSDPRGRPAIVAAAATDSLEHYWRLAKSYDRRAVVAASDALTDTGTVAVTLAVTDGAPFDFRPGQFIGVEAGVAGARRRRTPYCILSAPGEADTFTVLVRVVPDGPLSQYLTGLQVGDEVGFRGPTGRSMIPKEDDTELVLMATGVGVSPLYSLARHLLTAGTKRPIRLLWGLRLVEDICLVDQLDQLVEDHPNFTYQISLSQPPVDWQGLRGRLTETAPSVLGPLQGKHFYLCGNGAMTTEVARALADAGVNETLIYEEAFFNTRHQPDPAAVTALRDRLAAGIELSPVLAGDRPLFALERPIHAAGPAPARHEAPLVSVDQNR